MALPASGALSLKDIYGELFGPHTTQQISLRFCSSTAAKAIPDNMTEFYGYNNIKVNYGALTYVQDTPTAVYVYRPVVRTTQTSSETVSATFSYVLTAQNSGDSNIYWSRNSTISWTFIANAYYTTTISEFTISNIADTDIIRIKIELNAYGSPAYVDAQVDIKSVSLTAGDGSINKVSFDNWYQSLYYY